ncbi:MAG: hypothetical protein NTW67_02815, partial [Candidatus Woesearchaeota archaeon]|nr:hypothetical protein [Candidatus Woesearchaeota archaeon]
MDWVCFTSYVITALLIGLLLIHAVFRSISDYVYRKPSKEFLTWLLIIAILAMVLLNQTMCGVSSALTMILVLVFVLLLIFKVMYSQFKKTPKSASMEPVINIDELRTILKKTKHLKRMIKRMGKKAR